MATLMELQKLMLESGVSDETVTMIMVEMRRSFGGDKIYIPPPDSRKDAARADAIREAARRLPTGVVATRFGVHRSTVHKIIKK
jgi:hypothetical protein